MGGLRGSVEGFIMLPTAVKLVTDDSDRSAMGTEHGFCIRPEFEAQIPHHKLSLVLFLPSGPQFPPVEESSETFLIDCEGLSVHSLG